MYSPFCSQARIEIVQVHCFVVAEWNELIEEVGIERKQVVQLEADVGTALDHWFTWSETLDNVYSGVGALEKGHCEFVGSEKQGGRGVMVRFSGDLLGDGVLSGVCVQVVGRRSGNLPGTTHLTIYKSRSRMLGQVLSYTKAHS